MHACNFSVINRQNVAVQWIRNLLIFGSTLDSYWALVLVPVSGWLSWMNREPALTHAMCFALWQAFRWLPLPANIVVVPAIGMFYLLSAEATYPYARVRRLLLHGSLLLLFLCIAVLALG